MSHLYVLKLQNDKYYIGKTKDIKLRLDQHFSNTYSSQFIGKYKPVEVLETISYIEDFDEDKYVLKYMKEKGIDNVRGGSFSSIELTENEKNFISKLIKTTEDRCYNCGDTSHFLCDCPVKNDDFGLDDNILIGYIEELEKELPRKRADYRELDEEDQGKYKKKRKNIKKRRKEILFSSSEEDEDSSFKDELL